MQFSLPNETSRESICFPLPGSQRVTHHGEPEFERQMARLYDSAESTALERLIRLKAHLATLDTSVFFSELTEGMSNLLDADITFVMKRVLVDEQDAAVEMPPIGEPGSCLMAAALHYCAADGTKSTVRETKFHAWGCPCAYMRHDKVFLIPDNLNDFITNNPNTMPVPAEAYIAVPLFADGKCFAHFGAMWYQEKAARRRMSWAFIEALMHSLEDMVLDHLLQGASFVRPTPAKQEKQRVIPHEVVTVAQSLRPYAGSLSHELRTPMQGVVGMLDVMYATVEEAVAHHSDPNVRRVFQELKESIEVVQDSSRRAVEAADNVVHAYDMDMSVPDGPPMLLGEDSVEVNSSNPAQATDKHPEILVAGSDLPLTRTRKRKRAENGLDLDSMGASSKSPRIDESADESVSTCLSFTQNTRNATDVASSANLYARSTYDQASHMETHDLQAPIPHTNRTTAPGLRHTDLRQVFQYVISEGLKMGGRPDRAIAIETESGERIEVRSRGSDGTASCKIIEWSVDPRVPSSIPVDEKDLVKLVSCLFLNAIKFTNKDDGRVGIHAKMSSRSRYICITVIDNGPGIPAAFLPKLFKAFSQENASLTRQSEGLGLGLMVAKGIARKLGGDLVCTWADTTDENHGTEFEIRLPLIAGEAISRPSSPFASPIPRRAIQITDDIDRSNPSLHHYSSTQPASPRALARALTQAAESSCTCGGTRVSPSSPSSIEDGDLSHTNTSISDPYVVPIPHARINSEARQTPRRARTTSSGGEIDRDLASKYPLNFLVVEDNKINRKLLVNMLSKLGYTKIYEAHDGAEAVRQMSVPRSPEERIGVVLMDLWMPLMDGYEATERILSGGDSTAPGSCSSSEHEQSVPTVLAVTADVTDGALERAAQVGMKGFMTKPYKMFDLQRLITEYCAVASH